MPGWDTFRQQVKTTMELLPATSDDLAKVLATAYDMAVKTPPAGDMMVGNAVMNGNALALENIIKNVFNLQSVSSEQLNLFELFTAGFVAYWAGSTLQVVKQCIIPPAPGATINIQTLTVVCSNPGQNVPFPIELIKPESTVVPFIENFIQAAETHFKTISGEYNVNALYGLPPAQTSGPGIVPWVGYTIDASKIIENNEIEIKTLLSQLGDYETIDELIFAYQSGELGGDGSGQVGGAVDANLGELDLNAAWPELAAKFIAKKEGFTARATWDVNAYRLGFGTENIIGSDGKTRKVLPPPSYYAQTGEKVPANGDTTTKEAALKMLQIEVSTTFKKRLVGSEDYQIPEDVFEKLNDRQKAALISYVYNVGSLRKGIAKAIRDGELTSAAALIQAGPIRGGDVVYPGLIRRRNEEALLFRSEDIASTTTTPTTTGV